MEWNFAGGLDIRSVGFMSFIKVHMSEALDLVHKGLAAFNSLCYVSTFMSFILGFCSPTIAFRHS